MSKQFLMDLNNRYEMTEFLRFFGEWLFTQPNVKLLLESLAPEFKPEERTIRLSASNSAILKYANEFINIQLAVRCYNRNHTWWNGSAWTTNATNNPIEYHVTSQFKMALPEITQTHTYIDASMGGFHENVVCSEQVVLDKLRGSLRSRPNNILLDSATADWLNRNHRIAQQTSLLARKMGFVV